jgi:hypothetical protein
MVADGRIGCAREREGETVSDESNETPEFEKWAASRPDLPLQKHEFGRYDVHRACAWEAWQAREPARPQISDRLRDCQSCGYPRYRGQPHPSCATSVECHADKDGDCSWEDCPQIQDDEPKKSGRHCPLDNIADDDNSAEQPLSEADLLRANSARVEEVRQKRIAELALLREQVEKDEFDIQDLTAELACLRAERDGLRDALYGLVNLTDQDREGGLILSRSDQKPMTNGDQDIIDRAYVAADAALAALPVALAKEECSAYIGGPSDCRCVWPKGHKGNCHAVSLENLALPDPPKGD